MGIERYPDRIVSSRTTAKRRIGRRVYAKASRLRPRNRGKNGRRGGKREQAHLRRRCRRREQERFGAIERVSERPPICTVKRFGQHHLVHFQAIHLGWPVGRPRSG